MGIGADGAGLGFVSLWAIAVGLLVGWSRLRGAASVLDSESNFGFRLDDSGRDQIEAPLNGRSGWFRWRVVRGRWVTEVGSGMLCRRACPYFFAHRQIESEIGPAHGAKRIEAVRTFSGSDLFGSRGIVDRFGMRVDGVLMEG